MSAIRARFSMIDVVKSQHEIKKNKKLVLTNEVKIITASDETFDLWSEVISAAAQGDLMDVDSKTFSKFKERAGFEADKDAVLNREFFKFLGNLTEADHAKMCRHMLNRSGPSRTLNYPKVVVKQPATLLRDCYSYKDWIERRKRKVTARFQLNRLRPDLGIFTADGSEYVEEAWKKFKKDFNVTKASKRVLLDWGVPDSYYTLARATMNRNTTCEDISPYAQEFFKVFLDKRGAFQAPTGSICFRPFVTEPSTAPPRLGNWSSNQWRDAGRNSKVGIIDFRFIPGVAGIKESTVSKPYFERFLELLASSGQPAGLSDLPCWLFICGSEDALEQVTAFAQRPPHGAVFDLFPSVYLPAPNERLGGHSAKSRAANEPVQLLFLIKKELDVVPRTRREYKAPEHVVYEKPRLYKEMEYQMYPTELRMEFYLKMVDLFCKPGDSMLQIFGGMKFLTAAVVGLVLFSSSRVKSRV